MIFINGPIALNIQCDGCEETDCQDCCPHDDRDHGICLDCAHEEDPGEAIDRAMDSMDYDR